MPYLFDKYQYDAFVSYAHGPVPPGDEDLLRNWTCKFARDLEQHIRLVLPTDRDLSRVCKIWCDAELHGHEPITETLRERVPQSALLVVVMSDFFLDSPWCRDELSCFEEACRGRGESAIGRIFVVRAMPTGGKKWPQQVCDSKGTEVRGFLFHKPNEHYPVGWASRDPDYLDAVEKLATEMNDKLRALSGARSVEPAPKAVGTVFLGFIHDTLDEERDQLRATLAAKGVTVLPPEGEELIDEQSLREAMTRSLRRADAIVLIANEITSGWPRGQPGGFIGLQIQQARDIGKRYDLWLNVADLAKVKRPEYRNYLETLSQEAESAGLTIRHDDLESFASYVVKDLTASKPRVQTLDLGTAIICTNHSQDQGLGDEILEEIKEVLSELKQETFRFDFSDPKEVQIRSDSLQKGIRDASTILVLCFDQDWDWAQHFLRLLNGISQVRAEGKVRLFVTAPIDRKQADYDARLHGFRTANCTRIEPAAVRKRLRDAFGAAGARVAEKAA